MSFLNPFKNLVETKKYPHARAHRTSFWGKMWDTFLVFSGDLTVDRPNTKSTMHLGVFDYLTMGIHFIITELLIDAIREFRSPAIVIPLVALTLLFNLPRLLFAGISTLICLPFIGIAHAISSAQANGVHEKILFHKLNTDQLYVYQGYERPDDAESLKNKLFFMIPTRQLFYINFSGQLIDIPVKNIDQFEQAFTKNPLLLGEDRRRVLVKRDELIPHIENDSSFLSTNYSLSRLLETKNIDLEHLENTYIEVDQKDTQKIHLSFNYDGKLLTKCALDLNNKSDCKFFKNVRQLNIGSVQELIENKESLSNAFD